MLFSIAEVVKSRKNLAQITIAAAMVALAIGVYTRHDEQNIKMTKIYKNVSANVNIDLHHKRDLNFLHVGSYFSVKVKNIEKRRSTK